ncbi:TetR/AcrR family transcriptional regulator, partial [Mesorhizobium sp. M7A.F.Ca.US.001.01.1.1]
MSEAATIVAEAARQENVTRILDCAERLFRHYGYGKTNVA